MTSVGCIANSTECAAPYDRTRNGHLARQYCLVLVTCTLHALQHVRTSPAHRSFYIHNVEFIQPSRRKVANLIAVGHEAARICMHEQSFSATCHNAGISGISTLAAQDKLVRRAPLNEVRFLGVLVHNR